MSQSVEPYIILNSDQIEDANSLPDADADNRGTFTIQRSDDPDAAIIDWTKQTDRPMFVGRTFVGDDTYRWNKVLTDYGLQDIDGGVWIRTHRQIATLTNSITAASGSIVLSDVSQINVGSGTSTYLVIGGISGVGYDAELILVTAVNTATNTVTVTRLLGALPHTAGDPVYLFTGGFTVGTNGRSALSIDPNSADFNVPVNIRDSVVITNTSGTNGDLSVDGSITQTGTEDVTLNGNVLIDRTANNALLIRRDDAVRFVQANSSGKLFNLLNASDLRLYSDDGTTVQASISGTSGKLTARGDNFVPAYIFSTSSASTAINTTTAKTTFSNGSYTVPANTLGGGDMLHIRAWGTYGVTGTPNLTIRLEFGTSIVFSSGAINLSAAGDWSLDFFCRTTPSTSFGGYGVFMIGPTTATPNIRMIRTSTALASDWTTNKTIVINAQWSASSASNTVTMDRWVIQHT